MKNKLNKFAARKLFRLYLWLMKFGYHYENNNRVYDSYGIIDTLGNSSDNTKFTYSYSEELGGYYGIKLPFKRAIEVWDNDELDIKWFCKRPAALLEAEYYSND